MKRLIAFLFITLLLPIFAAAEVINDEILSGEWYFGAKINEMELHATISDSGEICIKGTGDDKEIITSDLTYVYGDTVTHFTKSVVEGAIILYGKFPASDRIILLLPSSENEYTVYSIYPRLCRLNNEQLTFLDSGNTYKYYFEKNKLFLTNFMQANSPYLRGILTQIYPGIVRYDIEDDGKTIFFIKPELISQ